MVDKDTEMNQQTSKYIYPRSSQDKCSNLTNKLTFKCTREVFAEVPINTNLRNIPVDFGLVPWLAMKEGQRFLILYNQMTDL